MHEAKKKPSTASLQQRRVSIDLQCACFGHTRRLLFYDDCQLECPAKQHELACAQKVKVPVMLSYRFFFVVFLAGCLGVSITYALNLANALGPLSTG